MVKICNFYDLKAWKTSHSLALRIYEITNFFPIEEKFGVTGQLRRSSLSIPTNIAEGFGRYHFKDKVKFYYHARGSIFEVQSLLLFIKDLKYVDINTCIELWSATKEIGLIINGLIRATGKLNK